MLRRAKVFKGYKLRARDGDIGKAMEFYFDDRYWTIRYLVADTGGWISGRQVLITPYLLEPVIEADQVLPVGLSMKQIEESPSLASHEPVSRQYETQYYNYYGLPYYADGPNIWGITPYIERNSEAVREEARREEAWDPHLRSSTEVTGYHIQSLDGGIGHVEDFIIDDETWSIRYLVVDTKNWWPGKHVLISPRWIDRVSWHESKVIVNLSREQIKQSQEYSPDNLSREYEIALHKHYDQQGYWDETPQDMPLKR
jgi:hypothetical protein